MSLDKLLFDSHMAHVKQTYEQTIKWIEELYIKATTREPKWYENKQAVDDENKIGLVNNYELLRLDKENLLRTITNERERARFEKQVQAHKQITRVIEKLMKNKMGIYE